MEEEGVNWVCKAIYLLAYCLFDEFCHRTVNYSEHSMQYKLWGRTNILPIGISFLQRTHLPNSEVPTLDKVNSKAASFIFAC